MDFIKPNKLTDDEIKERLLAAAINAITNPYIYHGELSEFRNDVEDLIEMSDNGHGIMCRNIKLDGYCFRCAFWLNIALEKNGIKKDWAFWGAIQAGKRCPRCARIDRKDGIYNK